MIREKEPYKNSRKNRFFRPKKKYSGIWISSIIFFDAACVFLCFYILNSPLMIKPGINIDLPQSSFSGGVIHNGIILSIAHNGLLFFQDQEVNLIQLKSYLEDINLNNSNATLIIEADKKSEHSMLVDVWEIAQQAGIKKITIATGLKAKDD
jgi:biopolymer transport protein ExbD